MGRRGDESAGDRKPAAGRRGRRTCASSLSAGEVLVCGVVTPFGEGYTINGGAFAVVVRVCLRRRVVSGAEERVNVHTFFVGVGSGDHGVDWGHPPHLLQKCGG